MVVVDVVVVIPGAGVSELVCYVAAGVGAGMREWPGRGSRFCCTRQKCLTCETSVKCRMLCIGISGLITR